MKSPHLFIVFLLVFFCFGCEKDQETEKSSSNLASNSDLQVNLGRSPYPFLVDSLLNPDPIQQNEFSTVYSFPLSEDASKKMIIRYFSSSDTSLTGSGITLNRWIQVEVESMLVDFNPSYIVNSSSSGGDSTSLLSGLSTYAALSDTVSVLPTTDAFPTQFQRGAFIDLADSSLNWLTEDEAQLGLSTNGFYLYQRNFSEAESPFSYSISDLFFPYWEDAERDYFVFRWTANTEFKYGWAELSYLNTQLTIHKVFIQR